ncbi:flagellar biosynthesis protein FlhB [Jannaschia sp. Os4]|uniref:EscU/YscU/HrcU family type III secretion system export apparatus switch protein n=1 Tax=Jannaschia sp. Os4 TaxID=2807617 RepID=UPI001939C1B0|nr:flagellar type III secretion system protein FlhB [Jannaschia sp. Os4]MBM2575663.1 flagellar biosynthesis protein FlhB [Jannaschia sp. Os4]
MSEQDRASKTEEPTEKKLRDARRKGDTPASREPAAVAGLVALAVIAGPLAPGLLSDLARAFAGAMHLAGSVRFGVHAPGLADAGDVLRPFARAVAGTLAAPFAVLSAAALVGIAAQGGVVVAPSRLAPRWSKLSPIGGLKRLGSPDALMEFAKNIAKVALVAALSIGLGWPAVEATWGRGGLDPRAVLDRTGGTAAGMIATVALLMAGIAGADVAWKRRRWRAKQRMTHKEIRDEHKDSEGDPVLRARRDGVRRARARQRMATAVPQATVVITNPTHFAVALRYVAGRDAAPVCVAKGTDLRAARIRELAVEAGVPLVENRPLARALHATVELEAQVPPEHWQAVAEIVGYVEDLRLGRWRRPPTGAALRHDA